MAEETSNKNQELNGTDAVTAVASEQPKLIELDGQNSAKPVQEDAQQSHRHNKIETDGIATLKGAAQASELDQSGTQATGTKKVIIGKVTKLCGSPTVVSGEDGEVTLLQAGDPVYAGEQIVNPSGTLTQITLTNGQVILLNENHSFSTTAIATAGGLDLGDVALSGGPLSAYPQAYFYIEDQTGLLNGSLADPDGIFFNPPIIPTSEFVPSLETPGGSSDVISTFPDTVLGGVPTSLVPDSSFLIEAIGSLQLRNTAATPAIANNLQVELDGATISGFTFDPGAAPLLVPAGGALFIADNGDWFVYDAIGNLVTSGNQAGLVWSFTDTNLDGLVDTKDRVGVNLKTDAATVIDSFLANGASLSGAVWTPGPAVPAAALALLGSFISHDTYSGQAGDQLAVLNALGITRPDLNNVQEATPNADNTIFVRALGVDSDSAADWTTTDAMTPGLSPHQPSPNAQDVNNDDFNPQASNGDPAAGQTIFVGSSAADVAMGGFGNDILLGEAGDDDLQGEANNDIIIGGAGHDKLDGGTGADVLIDGDGRDLVMGGTGNDVLIGSHTALGSSAPGTDEGDTLIGDTVLAGEELFTFNVVMVIDSSRSMGAVASDLVTNVNGNAILSTHNEFQIRGLPAGTLLESSGGFQEIVGGPGFYSQSMTKAQLDNLVIQLPGAEFAGGATPADFSLDVRGRSTALDSFQEFLGFSTTFGGSAAIVSVRNAVESLNQNFIDNGFDATTQVRVVSFNNAASVEVFGVQTDFNPSDPNLQTVIEGITPLGEADFDVGIQEAVNHLTTVSGTDIIYFFSDGNDFNGFSPAPGLTTAISNGGIDVHAYGVSIDAANTNVDLANLQTVADLGEFSASSTPTIINPTTASDLVDDPTDSILEVQQNGSDTIIAGDENDVIFGDSLLVDFSQISINSAIPVATLMADFNADPVTFIKSHIVNSTFDTALSGLGEQDFIDAGDGDDVVFGQGGHDEIIGGAGNDVLIGGHGNDIIDAGNQNDGESDLILALHALDGNDVIQGFDNDGAVHDVVSLDAIFDALGTPSGAARVADTILTQVASDVVVTINGVPDFSLRFENSSVNNVAGFSVGNGPGDDIFVG